MYTYLNVTTEPRMVCQCYHYGVQWIPHLHPGEYKCQSQVISGVSQSTSVTHDYEHRINGVSQSTSGTHDYEHRINGVSQSTSGTHDYEHR